MSDSCHSKLDAFVSIGGRRDANRTIDLLLLRQDRRQKLTSIANKRGTNPKSLLGAPGKDGQGNQPHHTIAVAVDVTTFSLDYPSVVARAAPVFITFRLSLSAVQSEKYICTLIFHGSFCCATGCYFGRVFLLLTAPDPGMLLLSRCRTLTFVPEAGTAEARHLQAANRQNNSRAHRRDHS